MSSDPENNESLNSPPPPPPSPPPPPEIIGHITFKDWQQLSQWAPQKKPFGKWHDVAIAGINFLLGTVVAGTVGYIVHTHDERAKATAAAAQTALARVEKERERSDTAAEKLRQSREIAEQKRAETERQDLKDAQEARFRNEESRGVEKERRALRVKETAAFLSEVANNFNAPLSKIAGYCRLGGAATPGRFDELNQSVGTNFTRRLNAKVLNDAYMKGNTFSNDYDFITWQLRYLRDCVELSAQGAKPPKEIEEEALKHIGEVEQSLEKRGYARSEYISESLPRPREEMMRWTHMVWDFTTGSLSYHLKLALDDSAELPTK